jgi:hypothetical protein
MKAERAHREVGSILAALSRRGAKNDGMGNIRELLINVVIYDKPKVLKGLDQKVRGMDRGLFISSTHSTSPPAKRQVLTHRVK